MRYLKFAGLLPALILLATACAGTRTADHAATLALDQLVRYEMDVNTKVRVENDYYDDVMDNAVKRINRLRESEQDVKLNALTRRFAEGHANADAAAVARDLPDFFEAAIKDWAAREAAYESLLTKTKNTLAANRKSLEVEQEKVRQLKTTLRALGEPQAVMDMMKLAIAFSKEVKVRYDGLKTDSDKAATAADNATKDTSKSPPSK